MSHQHLPWPDLVKVCHEGLPGHMLHNGDVDLRVTTCQPADKLTGKKHLNRSRMLDTAKETCKKSDPGRCAVAKMYLRLHQSCPVKGSSTSISQA